MIPWGIALKAAGGIVRRFWPVIVIVIAALWIASVVIERNTLRHEADARRDQAKAVQVVLKRAVDWRITVAELEATDAENKRIAEACCTDAEKWRDAFDAERRRPRPVNVPIVDQVDGTTAETMAVSGAKISRELAEQLRDRLSGGGS